MNHGDHSAHGMEKLDRCSMNMLWNTQIINTCIVFPQWHIRSNTGFVISFFIIVGLGIVYEWLRGLQHAVDRRIAESIAQRLGKGVVSLGSDSPSPEAEEDAILTGRLVKGGARNSTAIPVAARALRAALYGTTVFLSFFLMLVFMTYNAYLILAVVIGAVLGHYIFHGRMDVEATLAGAAGGKGMACH